MRRRHGPALRSLASVLAAAVGLAAVLGGCAPRKAKPEIDAVFVILVDTVRSDYLSCYGFHGQQTAAIDRLAASGVKFEHARSVASWTVPSMGAFFTSHYPTQLGLIENPPPRDTTFEWRDRRTQIHYQLPHGVPTMASLLDDAGFHPAAFVNQPLINRKDAFLHGFAEWCYTSRQDSVAWHDPTTPLPDIDYGPNADMGQADPLLVDAFEGWLEKNADLHPFVWLHLLKPHWPYTPTKYYPEEQLKPGVRIEPADFYAAEVRESDDMVGRALDVIDRTVGLDRSLVIFTSDHGEEFFEHGLFEHGHSLHREVIDIPLIMAGPSLPHGRTVTTVVRNIDVLPTVLDLVGAKAPAGMEGESLLPLMGKEGTDRMVYSEGMLYGSTKRSLIEDGYKLLFDAQTDPAYILYDVGADSLETVDVSDREGERAAAMRDTMLHLHARLVDEFEQVIAPTIQSQPETERILRAMRALGYVND